MIRVLVLADTHIRADGRRALPDVVLDAARAADTILHAGDVTSPHVLAELEHYAPVHAVLGNNDHGFALPMTLELDLDGVAVAMIHDSGATKGRAARMQRRFPRATCVVFGHSHQPLDDIGIDDQRLFNPGSPIERRNAPRRSYGWLEFDRGALVEHRIVELAEERAGATG